MGTIVQLGYRGRFSLLGSVIQQLTIMFASPDQTFRIRSRLIATRQSKRTLENHVQQLRNMVGAMHQDPVKEAIILTVFWGVLMRCCPDKIISVLPCYVRRAALRAEFDFKCARVSAPIYRSSCLNTSVGSNRSEPMNWSLIEAGEDTLQAAEQHEVIHKCYMCGST